MILTKDAVYLSSRKTETRTTQLASLPGSDKLLLAWFGRASSSWGSEDFFQPIPIYAEFVRELPKGKFFQHVGTGLTRSFNPRHCNAPGKFAAVIARINEERRSPGDREQNRRRCKTAPPFLPAQP